jgi:predicted DNA-binding transcriptional regulator AlpA
MMGEGKFPKNFRISSGRVAWLESDIDAWQQDRLREAGRIEEAA